MYLAKYHMFEIKFRQWNQVSNQCILFTEIETVTLFFLLIFIAYASSANRLRLLISALHDPKIEVQYKNGKNDYFVA